MAYSGGLNLSVRLLNFVARSILDSGDLDFLPSIPDLFNKRSLMFTLFIVILSSMRHVMPRR